MIKCCLWIGVCLFFFWSCSTEDILEKPFYPGYKVRALLSPNGLGDLSFNDEIYGGILEAKKENHFLLYYKSPADLTEAEQILREWQNDDDPVHCYTILGGSEYAGIARRIRPAEMKGNWLMFDTSWQDLNVASFRFKGYGVSFLVGMIARFYTHADTVVFIGGQEKESFVEECCCGFREGFLYEGGKEVVVSYLSEESDGFAMPGKAYQIADSLYRKYPFIYSIAGGSNNGIYQYLREYPDAEGYTTGVDIDQSAYSDRIIGSVVKNIKERTGEYIRQWMKGSPVVDYKEYGLSSGNIAFRVAEPYRSSLEKVLQSYFQIAVGKESEYDEKKKCEDIPKIISLPFIAE